ncbi:MAG: hypothetical protein LBK99_12680 [Opitutaceae bacterium]|nr:hypothetical protein [Opitutaceae bacterium]
MTIPDHRNDRKGVWHDILRTSRFYLVRTWHNGRSFRLIITGTGRKHVHWLLTRTDRSPPESRHRHISGHQWKQVKHHRTNSPFSGKPRASN